MTSTTMLSVVAAVALSAVAAAWDLRTGLIPNRLVAVGAAMALVMACVFGFEAGLLAFGKTLALGLLGAVLTALVPLLLFRFGGMGGGDVKLLAALGALLGPYMGLEVQLYAFVFAMFYAPVRLILDGKLGSGLQASGRLLLRWVGLQKRGTAAPSVEEMTSFRFGPAIFCGTLMVAIENLGGWV